MELCSVCNRIKGYVQIGASPFGPYSIAYCQECLQASAQPFGCYFSAADFDVKEMVKVFGDCIVYDADTDEYRTIRAFCS